MINGNGMYSEVVDSSVDAQTLPDSDNRDTEPLVPLLTIRRRDVKPPSVWASLRIWLATRLARWAYRVMP